MGLQSTLATKRKHEIAINNNKGLEFYTSCPPLKSTKWSNDRSSSIQPNGLTHNENSINKLEVVASAPGEPWNFEPVDCISKLQAVAVPTDTWGSITTRSTLATTLLSTDEMDDDDDDFEDDYEEEESVIPTYCPARYTCPPQFLQRAYSPHNHNNNNINNNGYIGKPNFYSEPFPQQNCSRTVNQHFRIGSLNWNNNHNSNYYNNMTQTSESPYTQQTIRCAENGKSYLELGNSSFNANLNGGRHHIKKCGCDGRGTWCNSKSCYRDIRLKIRNLSMFKLSKFRQVSEQSLYRSVLICNTLKHIDKEIEIENKDAHQQHHHIITNNNNDYSPIPTCTRVCILPHDNSNNLIFQPSNQFNSNNINNDDNSRECSYNMQQSIPSKSTTTIFNSNQQQCTNDLLHPYDHYPFREAQSGRATPFPITPTINHSPSSLSLLSSSTTPTTNTTSSSLTSLSTSSVSPENDSGFSDDDSNRSINWSSVLSLSSQSALDPLNNNDLFSILPTPIIPIATTSSCSSTTTVSINGTFTSTTSSISNNNNNNNNSISTSNVITSSITPTSIENSSTSWEYGFLDMDLGLGNELTELVPNCKISSEDLFKSISSPINTARYVHDNEIETPAHIMVGS